MSYKRRLPPTDADKPKIEPDKVLSQPTMCLNCHSVVTMYHDKDADEVKGSWTCSRCNGKYAFKNWKIKPLKAPKRVS